MLSARHFSSAVLLAVSITVTACAPFAPGASSPSAPAMDPLRIGVNATLTGPNAAVYAALFESLNVYFQQVNDSGGIGGRRVDLVVYDDAGEATRSAANAVKLVQQERVPLLVLASPSASYAPVTSISQSAGTPLLIAGACPRETLPPAEPLVFCSASYGTTYDSAAAVRFIRSVAEPHTSLALTGVDIPLLRVYLEAAASASSAAGLPVVTTQIMPLTVTDFSPYATQVLQSGATWMFATGPWGVEIGPYEALQKLGYTGNYLLWAHQAAEEEFRRRRSDTLYGLTGNALFVENLPVHREIRAAAERYASSYPAEQLAEGWVTAMAVDEVLRTSASPAASDLLASLNHLDLDTRGLRGTRLTFTPDNHFRQSVSYRVYRWDSRQERIVVVRDWEAAEVAAASR